MSSTPQPNGTTVSTASTPSPVSVSSTGAIHINSTASLPAEVSPIFLQTKAAQGIAGAFVALALFLSCQQVIVTTILRPLCVYLSWALIHGYSLCVSATYVRIFDWHTNPTSTATQRF